MIADRRVKIVATIGPSTRGKDNLKKAIMAGMNVARLNFSHGTHEDHLKVIRETRILSRELHAPVTLLQDLQGPKIRVGKLKNGSVELTEGQMITFSTRLELGEGDMITTDFKELPEVCKVGTRILLDDGLIEVKVTEVLKDEVKAEVIYGGLLKDRKGMNIPDETLPVECMTAKDLNDLEFGLSHDVDYVALSFVRKGADIIKLRELINAQNPETKIVAKIEMKEAIDNLEEIVSLSDGIMVARGDLAVEVGQTLLPIIQKRIIELCNDMGKPVITATQMLDSMVENPRPTRAEITDVANAVLDGSDALMLSAESASGKYPFKCIQTMNDIVQEVEREGGIYYKFNPDENAENVPEAIAASACYSALKLDASAIVCLTTTGKTAQLITRYRPKARVICVTHNFRTLNRLELIWGIQTFAIKPYKSTDEAMSQIEEILLSYGLVTPGDKVVLTLGVPVQQGAKTNSIRVYTMSDSSKKMKSDLLPLRCR